MSGLPSKQNGNSVSGSVSLTMLQRSFNSTNRNRKLPDFWWAFLLLYVSRRQYSVKVCYVKRANKQETGAIG